METPRSRDPLVMSVIAAIIVLVAAGALIYVFSRPGDREDRPSAGASDVPSASSAVTAPPTSTSGDGAEVLTSAPAGVIWSRYRGLALPRSPQAGPFTVAGPVLRGYSRDQAGALIAAVQISSRYLITPGGGWQQVLREQVVAGPGRTAFAQLRSSLSDTTPAAGFAQYAGFRFLAWSPDSPDLAVISLATRSPDGRLSVTSLTLRWVPGPGGLPADWRVEIPPSGLATPQVVTSLTGYVLWSAS